MWFLINILPLLSITQNLRMVWGRETVFLLQQVTHGYSRASFSQQCHTSLRSGSVSGLEVSVVVEELSSSAKESFSSSSCCFPFPLLSFSSRFFCGLVLRWIVFPFPRKIRMLQILSSSAQRQASSLLFRGYHTWLSLWSLLPVMTPISFAPLHQMWAKEEPWSVIYAPELYSHCLSVDVRHLVAYDSFLLCSWHSFWTP